MGFDTKPDLTNDKFEQFSGQTLSLSGDTNIYGELEIISGAIFKLSSGATSGKVMTSDADGVASWCALPAESITGGANGICASGTNLVLGGALTGNTTIDIGPTRSLTLSGGLVFCVGNTTIVNLSGTSASLVGNVAILSGVDQATKCQNYIQLSSNKMSVVDDINSSGMSYFEDYSTVGETNPRWIPDAAWVTGQTTGLNAITGATNGLCKNGQDVTLGGALTGDTTIDLDNNNLFINGNGGDFSVSGSTLTSHATFANYVYSDTIMSVWGEVQAGIVAIKDGCASCQAGTVFSTFQNYLIDDIHFSGISYYADYSTVGGTNPRWIPDIAWVTGNTGQGTITGGANGICASGTNLVLGGGLTGATTICAGSNPFTLSGANETHIQIADGGFAQAIEIKAGSGSTASVGIQGSFFGATNITSCAGVSGEATKACIFQDAGIGGNSTLQLTVSYSSNTIQQLELCGTDDAVFTDEVSCKGIVYAEDYSTAGEVDPRWIPDVAWVTGQTPSVSSSGENVTKEVTQATHGFAVKDFVGWSGGTYNKAIADGTYDGEYVGLVSEVPDGNTFCLTQSGYISGLTSLVANETYFLSETTPGLITTTEPSGDGEISKSILIADSTTSGWVLPYVGAIVSTGGTGGGTVNAADNGLTLNGDTIELGGDLCKSTCIGGMFDLRITGQSVNYIQASTSILYGENTAIFGINSTSDSYACFTTSCMTIVDDNNSEGLVYGADYSTVGKTNPRWIPDVDWVTGNTGIGNVSWEGSTVGGLGTYVDGDTVCAQPNIIGCLYCLYVGSGASTQSAAISLGDGRTDSGFAYVDLVGDTTYTDYGLRLVRSNTGENAVSILCHRGTGDLRFDTPDGGSIKLRDAGTTRLCTNSTGVKVIGQETIESTGAIYSGVPSLCISDTSNRGTILLESQTDNATDFFQRVDGKLVWGMSARDSIGEHALKFYPSQNGTSFAGEALTLTTGRTVCAHTCFKAPAITLTTGAAAGCVLQSDGSGNASWETPAAGGIAVSGTTDNALTTYINASGDICAEETLTYDGTSIQMGRRNAFSENICPHYEDSGAQASTKIGLVGQRRTGFGANSTAGDAMVEGGCANNPSSAPAIGGKACLVGGRAVSVSSSNGGEVLIEGGCGIASGTGGGIGGDVKICGGDGTVAAGNSTGGDVCIYGGIGTGGGTTCGCVLLGHGSSTKLTTTTTGVSVTGTMTATIVCGTTCVQAPFIYSSGMVCAGGNVCAVGCVSTPIVCATGSVYSDGCMRINTATGGSTRVAITTTPTTTEAGLLIYGGCQSTSYNTAMIVYNKGTGTGQYNGAHFDAYGSGSGGRSNGMRAYAGGKSAGYNNAVIGVLCGTLGGAAIHGGVGSFVAGTGTGCYAGYFNGCVYSNNCFLAPIYCATTAFRATGTGARFCGGTGCGTAVDWVATSDCRIKKCIQPITSALSTIDSLCGVCYELCEDNTKDMGLIAQDVLKIEPRLVSHGDVIEEYKKYGIEDELLSLKYDKFAGLFVEAIKELKGQNICLQNQINELRKIK